MANRELTVIASGGDGDGFAIGMSHTIHAIRRNMNITYIVMDNHIYGLTKGQTSPRSEEGFVTKSTPKGSIERPMHALELAIAAGATFVGQTLSSDLKGMTSLIEQAIQHEGFSLVNVFSPCVTFNKVNTYDWFKDHVKNLSDVEGYDAHDRIAAMRILMETEGLVNGLIYQNTERKPYEALVPGFREEGLVKQDLTITEDRFQKLMAEFM